MPQFAFGWRDRDDDGPAITLTDLVVLLVWLFVIFPLSVALYAWSEVKVAIESLRGYWQDICLAVSDLKDTQRRL